MTDQPETPEEEPEEVEDDLDLPEESWADLSAQVPEGSLLLGFTGALKYIDAEDGEVTVQVVQAGVHAHEALGLAVFALDTARGILAADAVWQDTDQDGMD